MDPQQHLDVLHATRALGAAALQLAVGELLAVSLGCSSSPLRSIGRWLIDLLPGLLVDISIALLESRDKLVLYAALLLLVLGGAGMAGATGGPVAAVAVLAGIGVLGIVASWRRPEMPRGRALAMSTVAAVTGPLALVLVAPAVLFVLAALVWVAAALWKGAGHLRHRPTAALPSPRARLPPPSPETQLDVAAISPLLTPTEAFYVTDVTFPPPRVDPKTWALHITGLVQRPSRLSYASLLAMESVEVDATLICVHNPVGGDRIGTARWQGVPLRTLLAEVGVQREADHVLLRSVDGYTGGIPLPLLERGYEPLVVFAMNGEPLREVHGAPVRLLVPGIYGYDANVKWLQRIELTRFEHARDYWERRGWPRVPARVKTQSRIDVPAPGEVVRRGPQVAAGVAWSPPEGISQVEVRVDGGPWQLCELAAELSPSAWRQWRLRWEASEGQHVLEVRAFSPRGVQEDGEGAPFPTGASGYHRVKVTVSAADRPSPRSAWGSLTEDMGRRLRLARAGARAWRRARPS
jgi:DMSO/TMAO reductase YedYZ molybdopterin-dependent catalytic subunit